MAIVWGVLLTFKRTDHFSCGHSYVVQSDYRLQLEKCPECLSGDYDGSLVESDEKEELGARIVQEPNSFVERIDSSGFYGASVFLPSATVATGVWNNIWGASSSANISPQPYIERHFPPQTVSNGQTFTIPDNELEDWAREEPRRLELNWNGHHTEAEYNACESCQHELRVGMARDYNEQHGIETEL